MVLLKQSNPSTVNKMTLVRVRCTACSQVHPHRSPACPRRRDIARDRGSRPRPETSAGERVLKLLLKFS